MCAMCAVVPLMLQLLTYDLSTGDVEELPEHLTQGLPMPNGATNWPGTDDTFVLLTQVRLAALCTRYRLAQLCVFSGHWQCLWIFYLLNIVAGLHCDTRWQQPLRHSCCSLRWGLHPLTATVVCLACDVTASRQSTAAAADSTFSNGNGACSAHVHDVPCTSKTGRYVQLLHTLLMQLLMQTAAVTLNPDSAACCSSKHAVH